MSDVCTHVWMCIVFSTHRCFHHRRFRVQCRSASCRDARHSLRTHETPSAPSIFGGESIYETIRRIHPVLFEVEGVSVFGKEWKVRKEWEGKTKAV